MNSLQMTEAKAQKLSEVEDLSLNIVKDALEDKIPADDERVKLAAKNLSVVAKNRQTSTHGRAINFGLADRIATDEQMRRYIAATEPEIKKALGK